MDHFIPQELKLSLKKRLIFTVTPGRSGTRYLAHVLQFVPNVVSYHEPEPRFSRKMRQIQQDTDVAYTFWIEEKLPCIASEQAPIYIETSHLFCKGFIEPLLELGISADIIILTRPHRQVAASHYRLCAIPGRTEDGLHWLLSPEDPGVLPLPGWQKLHDYQLCYWYCLEIERRKEQYANIIQENGGRVAKTSLHEIRTVRGFRKLTKQLDLPKLTISTWIRFLLYRNKRINIKTVEKTRCNLVLPSEDILDSLEREVLSII